MVKTRKRTCSRDALFVRLPKCFCAHPIGRNNSQPSDHHTPFVQHCPLNLNKTAILFSAILGRVKGGYFILLLLKAQSQQEFFQRSQDDFLSKINFNEGSGYWRLESCSAISGDCNPWINSATIDSVNFRRPLVLR